MPRKHIFWSLILLGVFTFLLFFSTQDSITSIEQIEFSDIMDSEIRYTPTEVIEYGIPPLSDEDFFIADANNYIPLYGNREDITTNENITGFRGVTQSKVYEVYKYETFSIPVSASPFSRVFLIYLWGPDLKTRRGIGVGDSISDALDKYGLAYKHDQGDVILYFYHHNYMTIVFQTDKCGEITGIRFESL